MCAHLMLLCVLLVDVQVPLMGNHGENTSEQRKERSTARSARVASSSSSHTERMEAAEPICRASIAPKELRHPTARPSRARSVPTTHSARHRNGSDDRRREKQSLRCFKRWESLSQPSNLNRSLLQPTCCIFPQQSESEFALFPLFTSPASRR